MVNVVPAAATETSLVRYSRLASITVADGRLKKLDVEVKWGPGRHTAGDNTFSYFTTPNGFAVEYTAELEQVDDAVWEPKVYPPSPEIMDQWGIGVGGPQTRPHPAPDPRLFQPAPV
jgi:hypothetical protein